NPDFVFGHQTRGVPFLVYAVGEYKKAESDAYERMRAWNYAIAAGDRFEESFSLGHFKAPGYHLRVYAPNGFYREFKGDRQDPPLVIGYQPEQHHLDPSQLTGNLEITLH